jgi:hypothetical protein
MNNATTANVEDKHDELLKLENEILKLKQHNETLTQDYKTLKQAYKTLNIKVQQILNIITIMADDDDDDIDDDDDDDDDQETDDDDDIDDDDDDDDQETFVFDISYFGTIILTDAKTGEQTRFGALKTDLAKYQRDKTQPIEVYELTGYVSKKDFKIVCKFGTLCNSNVTRF